MENLYWGDNTHHYNGKPVLFIERLQNAGFRDDDIKKILNIMNTTCNYCWDTDTSSWKRCHCSNDE